MTLQDLFDTPTALPTAPKVVDELIGSFDKASVSTEEIAKKVSQDPVLSAKLLRLANSAYYNVSRSIGTVEDAVLMLGFVAVRTLVISSGLVNGFKSVTGLDLREFWRYSMHTAAAARWIAKKVRADQELAFTIGLMHAIGQLVMHSAMPERAAALDAMAGPLDEGRLPVEQAALGFGYTDVGAELARRWQFPAPFSDAIAAFATPLATEPLDRVAAVVHLAVWRARAERQALSDEQLAATFPQAVADALGMEAGLVLADMPPLDELAAGLEEMMS
ncbi:HD-like signal output (HDOD) protein [Pseudoduganella lurida]|uniref:HD-like signal output (HDOD) protein n=1 Tax=Pseudoduganella lurida TaxID=1036180 RepID=A0A562RA80_9BURK|nr:HDOD domain-containing protein [Pseudoduganella lurida]TWI65296.1 HD-like signal output (HDOD) protein [Pseudoduganella lurida]